MTTTRIVALAALMGVVGFLGIIGCAVAEKAKEKLAQQQIQSESELPEELRGIRPSAVYRVRIVDNHENR